MDWGAIDVVFRAGAGALFALLALLLLRDARRQLVGRAGAALSLAGVCYVIVSTPGLWTADDLWAIPLLLGSIGLPVAFWVFAGAWFDDSFRVDARHALILAAFLTFGLAHVLWLRHERGSVAELAGLAHNGLDALFVGLGLAAAWRGRGADLVESRRRARIWLIAVVGLYMAAVIAVQLLLAGGEPPRVLSAVNAMGLLGLAAAIAIAILGLRTNGLLHAPSAPAQPDETDAKAVAALDRLMRDERIYRQEALSIGELAARVGVPEHRLRRVINGQLGYRNFNGYLNGFRLAEVKAALGDPGQREVPIVTIAFDAGFGSLATFNRAFRAETGTTPTAYRDRALRG